MYRRIALLLCAAAVLWIPSFVSAFAVSPATLDLSASRGETVQQTVSVINNGAAEQTYYFGTMSFVPDETSGIPQFLSSDNDRSGLAGWIVFPVSNVAIPAGTKVDVPFEVTVPGDVESGTYYAAVTVSTAPSEIVASNGATIEAKTAVLVFLTVEGETVSKFALLDFTSPDEGGMESRLYVPYAFRVQNQGNVAFVPDATITLTDMFGRVVTRTNANGELARVLPETTRTFEGVLAGGPDGFWSVVRQQVSLFAIGPVTATLDLRAGDQAETTSFSFWMFPWQLIVTAAGAVLLAWLVWRGITRRRVT